MAQTVYVTDRKKKEVFTLLSDQASSANLIQDTTPHSSYYSPVQLI